MMSDLAAMDATAQAQLVRDGEVSSIELVEAAIERTEAINPQLNAVIHPLYDEARGATGDGLPDGPFRGVPFLLKDLGTMLAGHPLHMGMRLLKETGFRAPVDTYLAQRFRDSGLVTIGKTNTPELGILPTTEPAAYGPTRNPWDISRSSGGSSGGSAAAVAAGLVPIAHANDGGGSIRIPASHCGVVGLKPTRQRVTQGPLIGDYASGLVSELVVSRSVRDTAAALDAVAGPALGDPYVAPPPARPYVDELDAGPGRLRIAVSVSSAASMEIDAAVVPAAEEAAALCETLGHSIEQRELGDIAGDGAQELVGSFLRRYMAAKANDLDQLSSLIGRDVRADDVEPLTWAMAESGRGLGANQYLRDVATHQLFARVLSGFLEAEADLLLTPAVGEPPPPLGAYDDSGPDPLDALRRAGIVAAFTGLFNATGHPAISLPLHWTADGLPVGVQLVAPFGREDLLVRIAAQLERARPWADRTPPVFASGVTQG
jgi:amidase